MDSAAWCAAHVRVDHGERRRTVVCSRGGMLAQLRLEVAERVPDRERRVGSAAVRLVRGLLVERDHGCAEAAARVGAGRHRPPAELAELALDPRHAVARERAQLTRLARARPRWKLDVNPRTARAHVSTCHDSPPPRCSAANAVPPPPLVNAATSLRGYWGCRAQPPHVRPRRACATIESWSIRVIAAAPSP